MAPRPEIIKTINRSCVTDIPLNEHKGDYLGTKDYAQALFNFIIDSASPISIGIQGDWGSGKTSLISLLQEKFNNDNKHRVLGILVNAWQLSLLQNSNSLDCAVNLLEGLSKGIHDSAAKAKWLNHNIKKQLGVGNEKLDNVFKSIKNGFNMITRVGAQAALNMITHSNITALNPGGCDNSENNFNFSESIIQLKHTITNMVNTCVQNSLPEKLVFFIDDLDRVNPAIAVSMLDIVKNIFDIPNCVFVLTIDYEVVVMGLKDKFGPMTLENERVFRQYFDKIIQIPFLMPIGTYEEELPRMIEQEFKEIGFSIKKSMNSDFFKHLAEDSKIATGGNPRSIKRIINTLSLLRYIYLSRNNFNKDECLFDINKKLEALFIIIALHINFPEISKRLMENSNFMKWSIKNMDFAWNLNAEKIQDEMAALSNNEFFDDDWEKVVFLSL